MLSEKHSALKTCW